MAVRYVPRATVAQPTATGASTPAAEQHRPRAGQPVATRTSRMPDAVARTPARAWRAISSTWQNLRGSNDRLTPPLDPLESGMAATIRTGSSPLLVEQLADAAGDQGRLSRFTGITLISVAA